MNREIGSGTSGVGNGSCKREPEPPKRRHGGEKVLMLALKACALLAGGAALLVLNANAANEELSAGQANLWTAGKSRRERRASVCGCSHSAT